MPELLRPAPPLNWRDRADAAWRAARERPGAVAATCGGVVLAAMVVFLLVRTPPAASRQPELSLPRASAASPAPTTTAPGAVVVHVAGAVVRPGLVRLAGGARVADAVDAAGGLRPDADLDRLNLAAPLRDGERVWVPVEGEEPPPEVTPDGGGGAASGAGAPAGGIVDLNTASLAELEALPGVGPATAQAILDQRRRVGRFRRVDDLLEVRGIGPAKLAAIRDRVRV